MSLLTMHTLELSTIAATWTMIGWSARTILKARPDTWTRAPQFVDDNDPDRWWSEYGLGVRDEPPPARHIPGVGYVEVTGRDDVSGKVRYRITQWNLDGSSAGGRIAGAYERDLIERATASVLRTEGMGR